MAHILIIESLEHPQLVNGMLKEVLDVITASGHSYDQLAVPSTKELPITLNLYSDNLTYESIICIGATLDSPDFALNSSHSKEIIRSLYEYSIYYAVPIGIAVVHCKDLQDTNFEDIFQYASKVASNTVEIMRVIRQINSLDLDKYVKAHQHN